MNPFFVLGIAVLASCSTTLSVQAGYTQVEVGGSVALDTSGAGLGSAVEQGISPGFGLGDPQGSPFVRVAADLGGPQLTASLFHFAERGSGTLAANFGGLPQATEVSSHLDFTCGKVSAAYAFVLGPVTVAPGLAMDLFDFDFRASDQFGNSEVIDELFGVPLVMLRAGVDVGGASLIAEAGYIEAPSVGNSTSRFFDGEAIVSWSASSRVSFLAGYRYIDVDATGETDTETFAVDLQMRGWLIGGGFRF